MTTQEIQGAVAIGTFIVIWLVIVGRYLYLRRKARKENQ